MGKKILIMSLALVMTLSFTACNGEPSAQEIVDGVIKSVESTKAYQFDMDMIMDMAGEVKGEAFEVSTVMDSSGALDLENRQMRMDVAMNMATPGEDEQEIAMEMYLIGDMMYMMMDVPEMGPIWMKSEIPEGYWEETNQIESQAELLSTAQVKVTGSERVRGIDCYVVELTPDAEQLWQLAMQQAQVAGREMPEVAEEFIKEMFRSFSAKYWIAKDTYFLAKTEIDMTVELTPEAMGLPEEEGVLTMDMAMSMLAYNYNQSVSIVLPPEADEAIEVPMGQAPIIPR